MLVRTTYTLSPNPHLTLSCGIPEDKRPESHKPEDIRSGFKARLNIPDRQRCPCRGGLPGDPGPKDTAATGGRAGAGVESSSAAARLAGRGHGLTPLSHTRLFVKAKFRK